MLGTVNNALHRVQKPSTCDVVRVPVVDIGELATQATVLRAVISKALQLPNGIASISITSLANLHRIVVPASMPILKWFTTARACIGGLRGSRAHSKTKLQNGQSWTMTASVFSLFDSQVSSTTSRTGGCGAACVAAASAVVGAERS